MGSGSPVQGRLSVLTSAGHSPAPRSEGIVTLLLSGSRTWGVCKFCL